MLRALFEREIVPDLVLGTVVGALNGAMVARDPSLAVIDRLTELWRGRVRGAGRCTATARCARSGGPWRRGRTSTPPSPLAQRLADEFGDLTFEDLPVRFQVCAASIERAAEHWFTPARWSRRSSPAPPSRACCRPRGSATSTSSTAASSTRSRSGGRSQLGATLVYVLQVGRIDRPLHRAQAAVGGGPGVLRDRPAAPVRPRAGRAARAAWSRTCCRPGARRQRDDSAARAPRLHGRGRAHRRRPTAPASPTSTSGERRALRGQRPATCAG